MIASANRKVGAVKENLLRAITGNDPCTTGQLPGLPGGWGAIRQVPIADLTDAIGGQNKDEYRQVVGFGELLLRLGTRRFQRFTQAREFEAYYTGAEANTCVSLANFGVDAYAVSKVPANDMGQACINFLKGHGLNTDYILRGGGRLGLFYLEAGASQRPSKVIYDRASNAFTTLKRGELDWRTILQGKDWFHFSGTAPALGSDMPEVVEEACRTARQMGVTVSCDLR